MKKGSPDIPMTWLTAVQARSCAREMWSLDWKWWSSQLGQKLAIVGGCYEFQRSLDEERGWPSVDLRTPLGFHMFSPIYSHWCFDSPMGENHLTRLGHFVSAVSVFLANYNWTKPALKTSWKWGWEPFNLHPFTLNLLTGMSQQVVLIYYDMFW